MPDNIEKDYDTIVEEVLAKIEQAAKLLDEAKQTASQASITLYSFDDWINLRNAIRDILTPPDLQEPAWDQSTWCLEGGWVDSGCSF